MSVLEAVKAAFPNESLETQLTLAEEISSNKCCGAICEDAEGMDTLIKSYQD